MAEPKMNKEADKPDGKGLRIAIVASQYNASIVDALCDSAIHTLQECGVREQDIRIVRVPGAYEIPLLLQTLAPDYDAMLALGCVIRGQTRHFDQVVEACSSSIQRIMLEQRIPIAHGILAVENADHAQQRTHGKYNRGREIALTAVAMANIMRHCS